MYNIVFKYASLTPPPVVEVPVTSNERKQSYVCTLGVSMVCLSTIFRLNFVFLTVFSISDYPFGMFKRRLHYASILFRILRYYNCV